MRTKIQKKKKKKEVLVEMQLFIPFLLKCLNAEFVRYTQHLVTPASPPILIPEYSR